MLYSKITVAAENEDIAWPDGNENLPDGAPISRFSTVSNAPSVLYGRSRAITFLSTMVERNNPKSSETIITIPVFRDFLKQSIISAVTAHTMPPLPKNVISGIIVSRNGLRMLWIAFKILKSICVIKSVIITSFFRYVNVYFVSIITHSRKKVKHEKK